MKRKTDSSGSSCPDEGQQSEPRAAGVETTVSQGLRVTANKSAYDAACKRVLSEKAILARIMKACLDEYKDCDVNDIAERYIEGQPQVGNVMVAPDEEMVSLITGMDTEDKAVNEHTIYYDIRFRAIAPGSGAPIALIINVEAQSNYHPGYPLIKRAIYYCSRMISSQYGREFTGSHYEKIKKVYSIWICTRPPQYRQNTISQYQITKKDTKGTNEEPISDYDLLSVIILRLGNPRGENYDGIIRMLDVLLSNKTSEAEKRKILLDDYNIEMTERMRQEVSDMCNLSEGIRDETRAETRTETLLDAIRNLVESTGFSVEQAMAALKIPGNEREKYRGMLGQ